MIHRDARGGVVRLRSGRERKSSGRLSPGAHRAVYSVRRRVPGTIGADLEPGDVRTSAAIGAETPGFLTEVPGPPPSLPWIDDPLPDSGGHRLDPGPDPEFRADLLEVAVHRSRRQRQYRSYVGGALAPADPLQTLLFPRTE